jgi:hypothetical protein
VGLAKVSAERIGSALDYMRRLEEVCRAAGYDIGASGPRASGQLAIPAGPHAIPTPPPGFLVTPAPYASATPAPYSSATPFPGATPMPFHVEIGSAHTLPIESLPQAARQVSIHDIKEPLPKKYKTIGIGILVAAVVGAILLVALGGGDAPKAKKQSGPTVVPVPVPVGMPVDTETVLKAALHDLENGKTCADRKAAIPALVKLGDERAIAPLKKARYRMRGGVLGIGDSNTNACLKADAESAIIELGGAPK